MPDEFNNFDGNNIGSFVGHLSNFIGKTVTIFTTSGGESGEGFTGVLMSVNCTFVRLLVKIGPGPACALGNSCSRFSTGSVGDMADGTNRSSSHSRRGRGIRDLGAVVDIPINRIASFVHNAI